MIATLALSWRNSWSSSNQSQEGGGAGKRGCSSFVVRAVTSSKKLDCSKANRQITIYTTSAPKETEKAIYP